MKKIMFNDKYGLTEAVLEGRKTMTRRIIPEKYYEHLNAWENPVIVVPLESIPDGMTIEEFAKAWSEHTGRMKIIPVKKDSKVELFDARLELVKNIASFKVGEVVAVAKAYKDIEEFNPESYEDVMLSDGVICEASHPYSNLMRSGGWDNKMFVRAYLMPHQIRITNIRVERLQDISDEDCFREGVRRWKDCPDCPDVAKNFPDELYEIPGSWDAYLSPRKAFASLIDKVSGIGTWGRNPWVYVYEFELVK